MDANSDDDASEAAAADDDQAGPVELERERRKENEWKRDDSQNE